jgi:hypothetical protein
MEISDFLWLSLESLRAFSISHSPHRSRMRSHVLLVADLIDPYQSPRCITRKHGPFSRFYQPCIVHTFMTRGRSYPSLCGVHNNTPLAVVTHNTPSYAVLSTLSGAGCVATQKDFRDSTCAA